jgi:hypothetical protein
VTRRSLNEWCDRFDKKIEPLVIGLCGYEAVAIVVPGLPTLSTMMREARRRHWLGNVPPGFIVAWLALHWFREDVRRVVIEAVEDALAA